MENRVKGLIRGAIKRVWHRHPTRLGVLNRARIEEVVYKKDGTLSKKTAVFFICERCGQKAKAQATKQYPQVHVDHIEPVVPIGVNINELSFDEFIVRLMCEADNLQVLCSPCHDVKTKAENVERRKQKGK